MDPDAVMYNAVLVALWAGASFVLYKVVAYILTELHYRKEAKRLGCEPAYSWKFLDFQGIRNVLKILAADKQSRIPDYFKGRVDDACAEEGRTITAFAVTMMGSHTIFTTNPKNVQAVLATQFKDFGLGERRNVVFSELLGHGIVRYRTPYVKMKLTGSAVFHRRPTMAECSQSATPTICS